MLCYWILKRTDGTPVGLVRVQNDRVLLKPTVPIEGSFTLFSETDAVPIVPGSETHLPGAAAVLGMENERVTCFAAADNAASAAHYRKRLSRNRTNVMQNTPSEADESKLSHVDISQTPITEDNAPESDCLSRLHTIEPDSIADSAQTVQAFSALLQRAEAFYAAYEGESSAPTADTMAQKEDIYMEEHSGIDLFSQEYPGARWRYVDGTDVLPHYEGTWRQPNGQTLHILAVRGRAAPRPPRALLGFTRFLRDRDGTGYWLRLTPLP